MAQLYEYTFYCIIAYFEAYIFRANYTIKHLPISNRLEIAL